MKYFKGGLRLRLGDALVIKNVTKFSQAKILKKVAILKKYNI